MRNQVVDQWVINLLVVLLVLWSFIVLLIENSGFVEKSLAIMIMMRTLDQVYGTRRHIIF